MKTISDLRHELSEIFMALKNGDLEPKVATEMNNAAGKMIATAKLQLSYHQMRQEIPEIDFLNG